MSRTLSLETVKEHLYVCETDSFFGFVGLSYSIQAAFSMQYDVPHVLLFS